MCEYHCRLPTNRALVSCLSTDNTQISTLTSVSTCPFTEYPTATGQKSSAYPDCMLLSLLDPDIAANESRDGHSHNGNSVGDGSVDSSGPSSSSPTASSADSNSSWHSHPQHYSSNMSALTHSGTEATFARDVLETPPSDQMAQHVALIPRSALQEGSHLSLETSAAHVSSLLDMPRDGSMNLNTSLDIHSSSSLETTHNSKANTDCNYTGSGTSDTRPVFRSEHAHASSTSTARASESDTGTFRASSNLRKPIPSQWVAHLGAPNLATAQRAKEREHKLGSAGTFLTKQNSVRSSRSVAEIGRPHVAEGSSFLTKSAHVPLDSNLASPTAGRSPTKPHHAPKPAWNSPAGSPRRKSPQQQAHLVMRTSPTRTSFLAGNAAWKSDRRGTSSVATSVTGDSIYHSADSSPVRDGTRMTLSFESAAQFPDDESDDHIAGLHLHTDGDNAHKSSFAHTSIKAATVGRSSKPRLNVDIPFGEPHANPDDRSSTSATSNSTLSSSPASTSSFSRIPRVVAPYNVSSAQAPTRSSTLKRVQSAKSLTSPKTKTGTSSQRLQHLPSKSSDATLRHVRTVDNSGSTPILSRQPTRDSMSSTKLASTMGETDLSSAQQLQTTVEHVPPPLPKSKSDAPQAQKPPYVDSRFSGSRASSASTVRAGPVFTNPAVSYAAILSGKTSEASDVIPDTSHHVPEINSVKVHSIDTDTSTQEKNQLQVAAFASASPPGRVQDDTSARGRTEQYVPRNQREGSSLSSDLRATAAEFVPHPATIATGTGTMDISQADPTTDFLGPAKHELDMYGIPWYYYMYQVQLAFEQGFRKGRSRSPKKTRQKKQPPSAAPSADARPQKTAANTDYRLEQQYVPTMPSQPSTIHLAEQRAQKHDNGDTLESPHMDGASEGQRPFSPFAAQKDVIDRQSNYSRAIVTERPVPGVDLTTIRNVGLPGGSQTMSVYNGYQNTMPTRWHNPRRNHHRSDNGLYSYRGRGTAGLRMAETVPFPAPVAPQGRPIHLNMVGGGCGLVNIIHASEHIGGAACHDCEPDHPLD